MKKLILLFILVIYILTNLKSQTDTEFWYAFTSLDETYGGGPGTPNVICLRISAGTQDADVTVSFPADAGGSRNKTFHITANNTYTFPIVTSSAGNWPTDKTDLNFFNPKPTETFPQLNGMHVTSTAKISAYVDYPHAGDANYFVLKGKNALGKHFYLPFQNAFNPGSMLSFPNSYVSFSIIATEDNTKVQIVPTKELIGHPANIPFTIDLMKGQSYTFFSKKPSTGDYNQPGIQPSGSTVDVLQGGDVAITIATDLAVSPTAGVDMEGDQIVPVEKLGSDFIIYNSNIGPEEKCDDHFMFVATVDNTKITLSSGETKTLNKGECWDYIWITNGIVPLSFKSVSSTQPVYLYQTTLVNKEIASALIPSTTVGGSKSISFNLSNVSGSSGKLPIYRFYITCDNNAASKGFTFTLSNGTKTQSFGSNITFQSIQGKPGYKGGFLQIDMNTLTSVFPSGQDVTMAVKNNNMFNLGWTAVTDGGMAVYGIFTDFVQQTNTEYNVLNISKCDPIHTLDIGSKNIAWYLPGRIPAPNQSANPRTITEDKVWVEYNNSNGDNLTDTVIVKRYDIPELDDKLFCPKKDSPFTFDVTVSDKVNPTYKWNTGATTPVITVDTSRLFIVTITTKNCEVILQSNVVNNCGLKFKIPNVFTPNGDGINDVFKLDSISGEVDKFEIIVCNRWGVKVYESKDIYFNWDGNKMSDGTYFWVLNANGKNGDRFKLNGIVTILR